MAKRLVPAAMLILLGLFAPLAPARAQWAPNGVGVATEEREQFDLRIASDGARGAIVVWRAAATDTTVDIYAQRIDMDGNLLWGTGGVAVRIGESELQLGAIVPDGSGGAVVTWTEYAGGEADIYAQRVGADGSMLWGVVGVVVCAADYDQYEPCAVPDGSGGAIVAWIDLRSGNGDGDVYAQRVGSSGDMLWTGDGVAIVSLSSSQYYAAIGPDGSGGAVVAWIDRRSGLREVYSQRIGSDGAVLWTADGVAVCVTGADEIEFSLASDGSGAVYAWREYRMYYPQEIRLQKLDLTGAPLWAPGGLLACSYSSDKYSPRVVMNLDGGAIVAWNEPRGMCAQRVSALGAIQWSAEGNEVFDAAGPPYYPFAADGAGGVVIGTTRVSEVDGSSDVYAQRVDENGDLLWMPPGGVAVCTAPLDQGGAVAVSDGTGAAIFAWQDTRNGNGDVYAQRIAPTGFWGEPEPEILSCLDVPDDEGGFVRIRARASALDVEDELDFPIAGYNVWRLLDEGGGDWEVVMYWFATRDTVYTIAVPTRGDSTVAGIPWETYRITAHTTTPGIFVTATSASGYSVDNLAPGMTEGFAGDEVAEPAGLLLTWTPNPAIDLWKYDVHRGGDELFTPDASNLLASTDAAEYLDATWAKSYQYYYKLVAVDRHGNASPAALLRPEDVNVGVLLQSYAAVLSGSCVEIRWALAESSGETSFAVLRSAGAGAPYEELSSIEIERSGLSFVARDASVEPGTAYAYRVDVIDASGRRTLFETEAIAIPEMPLTLHQNRPNPFNPSTAISYYLPEACAVSLEIYDASGKLVARPFDGARQERGAHSVEWRGVDEGGRAVSSGVYFYRLRAGRETLSRKMVLIK